MGLLDGMNSDEFRMGLGLLGAASARSDGAGFGQRLQEGMSSFDAYKQGQLKQKFMQAQMQEHDQKIAMEKIAYERAVAKQKALPTLWQGGSQALAPLMADPEAGILESKGRPAVAGKFNVQAALQAGYTPDEIAKLDGLRNVGLDEVARTMKGMVNGREVDQQLDKFGRPVGQSMEQYKAPIMVDRGGQIDAVSPYMQPGQSFAKTMTFADRNSAANTGMARERLNFDKAGGAEGGKPQLVDGQWVYKPSAQFPQGRTIPADGFQKQLGETAKKQLTGVESLNGAISNYLEEMKGWDMKSFGNLDKRAAMGTKYNNMMLQAKEAYNLGVLNGPDYDILQAVVTDPTSIKGAFISNSALTNQAKELSRMMSQTTAPAIRDSGKKAEVTNVNTQSAPLYDSEKESRYQEWKRRNAK